jgi:hypothetical protein
MARRKNGLFSDIFGTHTTYHRDVQAERREYKKIYGKSNDKKQLQSYLGVKMYKLATGEYMTGLDDSRFDTLKDAKNLVKSMRIPNPAILRKGIHGIVKLVGNRLIIKEI